MKRIRMVGDYELVYEQDMKMYRILKKSTEDFSRWFNTEEADDLQKMNDDDFFAFAEDALKKARNEERKDDEE